MRENCIASFIDYLLKKEKHTVKNHAYFITYRWYIGLFIVVFLLQPVVIHAEVTLDSLLKEMTDLKRLMSSPQTLSHW